MFITLTRLIIKVPGKLCTCIGNFSCKYQSVFTVYSEVLCKVVFTFDPVTQTLYVRDVKPM